MDTRIKSDTNECTKQKENLNTPMPDEERRKILKKLAACAFAVPAAMVLLEGGDNLTYAGRSAGGNNPLNTGVSYRPVDGNN